VNKFIVFKWTRVDQPEISNEQQYDYSEENKKKVEELYRIYTTNVKYARFYVEIRVVEKINMYSPNPWGDAK
jgi:hypothetical protein